MVPNRSWGEGRRLFRDPVHGFIGLEPEETTRLLPLIDSPKFQRLRRVSHLGTSRYTYHGAEHSRFGHAMGTMWNMRNLILRYESGGVPLQGNAASNGAAAALLHDLGHGPLSHVLEEVTEGKFSHETMTRQIIEHSGVKDLLQEPGAVLEILSGLTSPPNRWLSEAISGPLDVDKMHYLLRDSQYCGVEYGLFDFDRLFSVLRPVENGGVRHLGIEFKGVQAAEGFVLLRGRMYWAVYFHKTTRGVEKLVSAILRRAKDLQGAGTDVGLGESLGTLLSDGEMDIEDFQEFDDTSLFAQLKAWKRSSDAILSDLCNRFFGRRLLKAHVVSAQQVAQVLERRDEIQQALDGLGLDFRYYFAIDDPSMSPYEPGGLNDEGSKIVVEAEPSSGTAGQNSDISWFSRIVPVLRGGGENQPTGFLT